MKLIKTFLLVVLAGFFICNLHDLFAMEMPDVQVKVKASDSVISVLRSLKLEARSVKDGDIILDLTHRDVALLKKAGVDTEIIIDDMDAIRKQEIENSRDYYSYDTLRIEMLNLEVAYPTLAMTHVYGQSVQGRDIMAIKISDNVTVDEAEIEIRWDGSIHGDEKSSMEVANYLVKELLENYVTDPQITDLVNNR